MRHVPCSAEGFVSGSWSSWSGGGGESRVNLDNLGALQKRAVRPRRCLRNRLDPSAGGIAEDS